MEGEVVERLPEVAGPDNQVADAKQLDLEHAAGEIRNPTDMGNAERFGDRCRDKILHVHGIGWMVWDGKRWQRDKGGRVTEQAKKVVRTIIRDAYRCEDPIERGALLKWAVQCESSFRISSMLGLARSDPRLAVGSVELLDADPNVLNVGNGILELGTLELSAHDSSALLTRIARAEYDDTAKAPRFQWTIEYFLPDPEVRRWFQMAMGYSILGTYSEWLFIPWGSGANGKSTILDAIRYALGDYAYEASRELLVQHRETSAGQESALASTRGRRLITTIETEQGKRLAEVLVKQFTGESVITAKYMRQDPFEFENTAAVWLATNHKPIVQGTDHGIWRRLRLIPFDVKIADDLKRPQDAVKRELHAEADGILRWLIEGLRMYRERGSLDPAPAVVDAATAAYREDMDVLGQWFEECCVEGADMKEAVTEVRRSYVRYCKENGIRELGTRTFNEQLEERGFVRKNARVPSLQVDGPNAGRMIATKQAKCWIGFELGTGPLTVTGVTG